MVVVRDKVGDGQQQHVRMAVVELQGQPLRRSTSRCSGGCSKGGAGLKPCSSAPPDSIGPHSNRPRALRPSGITAVLMKFKRHAMARCDQLPHPPLATHTAGLLFAVCAAVQALLGKQARQLHVHCHAPRSRV